MGLVGAHQRDNAVAAASAALVLRQQGFDRLGVPSILAGLARARLPGRFQVSLLSCRSCRVFSSLCTTALRHLPSLAVRAAGPTKTRDSVLQVGRG